jgi:hypothetical protein
MTGRFRFALALMLLAVLAQLRPALADHSAECHAGQQEGAADFPLPHVVKALAGKQLDILVVGAGSSVLPGPNGVKDAYPARLQNALSEKLPGVAVRLTTDVKSRRTAAEMVKTMPAVLAAAKPALVVWQTGTVDAMQSVDPDQFSAAVELGINLAHSAGADTILVNSQYSPRTESVIALSTYDEDLRWVAVQQQIPLFNRFSIMKSWSDSGTFDLYSPTKKLDIAERVHDCIGRLLADLVLEATKPAEPPPK